MPYAKNCLALGNKIRVARTAKGLTQRQLADLLHVTQAKVSSIERGDTNKREVILIDKGARKETVAIMKFLGL